MPHHKAIAQRVKTSALASFAIALMPVWAPGQSHRPQGAIFNSII